MRPLSRCQIVIQCATLTSTSQKNGPWPNATPPLPQTAPPSAVYRQPSKGALREGSPQIRRCGREGDGSASAIWGISHAGAAGAGALGGGDGNTSGAARPRE
eukprot:3062189-Prymnesium_polylepis.1